MMAVTQSGFKSDSQNIIMIKLDGFFHTIHKDIGLAVSLKDIMLSLRLRTISFKTYSLTNIFVYRAQSIQFYIKLGHNDQ